MIPWENPSKLDYLVCGHPITAIDGERPYGLLRGNATRAFGLANNLAKLGLRVGLVVDADLELSNSPLIATDLVVVHRSEMGAAATHADVLLLACTNLKTLREHRPEVFEIAHAKKWVASCFDNNGDLDVRPLVSGVIGMSFNNQFQAQHWANRGLGTRVRVMPYGVDENAYIDRAISSPDRPTAVWIGALRLPTLLQRIVDFARVNPECEVRVISGQVFDQRMDRGAVGSQDRPYVDHRGGPVPNLEFDRVLTEWCGCERPSNLLYLGSCPGGNADELGRASMALGFSRKSGQLHDDSKILDYLRSGAPVICDDGQPAHRFVGKSGHGVVVPFGSDSSHLRAAYLRCLVLGALERKRKVAADIREAFGWPALARRITDAVKEDSASVRLVRNERKSIGFLAALRDKHKGQRCFIVGCAPSLKSMDLSKLQGEWAFTVNRGYLAAEMGLSPTAYYVVGDPHTYTAYAREIRAATVGRRFYRADVWATKEYSGAADREDAVRYGFHNASAMDEGHFCTDATQGLRRGFTVVLDAAQLAFHMGFSEVYIIGCDLNYQGSQTHVYGTGAYEQRRRNDMPIDRVLKAMSVAADVFQQHGRLLANAGVGGNLNTIPRVAFDSLFEPAPIALAAVS